MMSTLSFIDYARRQASKYGIKGSRINAALQVLEILKKEDLSKRMREVWSRLPRIEHCYDVTPDPSGMRQYQVCGKSFQESSCHHYLSMAQNIIDNFKALYSIKSQPGQYNNRALLVSLQQLSGFYLIIDFLIRIFWMGLIGF